MGWWLGCLGPGWISKVSRLGGGSPAAGGKGVRGPSRRAAMPRKPKAPKRAEPRRGGGSLVPYAAALSAAVVAAETARPVLS